MNTTTEPNALPQPLDGTPAPMPQVVDQVALARLYGEPLFSMPTDLYIPPDALEVMLDAFEDVFGREMVMPSDVEEGRATEEAFKADYEVSEEAFRIAYATGLDAGPLFLFAWDEGYGKPAPTLQTHGLGFACEANGFTAAERALTGPAPAEHARQATTTGLRWSRTA